MAKKQAAVRSNKVPRDQRVRQGGQGRQGSPVAPGVDYATQIADLTARLNRVGETNPFGSMTYETDPTTGQVTQRTSLAQDEQRLLDQQRQRDLGLGDVAQGQTSRLQGLLSQPFSLDGIGNDPSQMDFSADRKRVEDAAYNQVTSRLQPQFEREEAAFRTRMANEGIPEGSERYNTALSQMKQSQNDAFTQAGFEAIGRGGEELTRSSDLASRAREMGVSERLLGRNQPLSELSSILGMQKGVMLPQFQQRSDIDIGNTALGYGQLGLSEQELAENRRHNVASESVARLAASKSGSGPYTDPFALANLNQQHAMERLRLQSELERGNQPSTGQQIGGFLSNLGSSFAGSYLQGLGKKAAGR